MRHYSVAVIAGDGIGAEVIPAGLEVLRAVEAAHGGFTLDVTELPWSCDYYLQHGTMMPPDGMRILEGFQAIYLGAVGFPSRVPDHVSIWGLLLRIRKEFDLYANVRPCKLLAGVPTPLRDRGPGEIDMVIVRENTEGEYSGVGGRVRQEFPDEVAIQTAVFTRRGTERIIRYAFELAKRQGRRWVTSITKSNALQHSAVFWDEVFRECAAGYPEIEHNQLHVDAAAARFVTHPQTLDVVVASNLFGDILSDLGSAIIGSLGFAASANVNPETGRGLFEPVHGSAPDIAGRGIANPIATIWAGAMMLEHLAEPEAAQLILRAIEQVTSAKQVATPDMGGQSTTAAVARAIATAVRSGAA